LDLDSQSYYQEILEVILIGVSALAQTKNYVSQFKNGQTKKYLDLELTTKDGKITLGILLLQLHGHQIKIFCAMLTRMELELFRQPQRVCLYLTTLHLEKYG
jgi:hypothetical protein